MNCRLIAMSSAVIGAVALLAASTATASAAPGDTTTTFSINGGALSVTVQADATLTNAGTGAANVSGNLGAVAVTDNRGGTAPWNVMSTSTVFTNATGGATSNGVSYNAGTVAKTGDMTIADGADVTLSGVAAEVAGPTAVAGNNAASWNPTLTVSLPSNALAGAYSGTVNTSIS